MSMMVWSPAPLFRRLRDEGVPVVVPPSRHLRIPADIGPGSFEHRDMARWVGGARLSQGKTYQPGRTSLEFFLCTIPRIRAAPGSSAEFKGIVRPSPPSVLLRPTARKFLSKWICAQVRVLISLSRIPALAPCSMQGRYAATAPCAPESRKPKLVPPNITSEETHADTSLFSLLQCCANGPYIQKHLLRAALFGSFNRNEPIACTQPSFVAVRIGDDAATADVIRNPHNRLECF
ncbi:MAG: hypothetical protein QOE55_7338 [Acidobacteriaceae bacterium]|nr:hypothetical protein [Acidobacteriaceae bacterium]